MIVRTLYAPRHVIWRIMIPIELPYYRIDQMGYQTGAVSVASSLNHIGFDFHSVSGVPLN